jgi:DNA segregation ATPase FtsK/SpoIIIE, S-DNA-T family
MTASKFFKDLMADYNASEGKGKYPISLGYTETGTEVVLDMKQLKHVLISGMSQSGKSTMVRKILPSLVVHAEVAIYSTKDSDFIDYEETAYTCSDLDEMSSLIRRTVGEVERRNDTLRKERKANGIEVKCADKPMVILIDEFQSFAELAGEATMLALKRIIREGAGLNVFVYIITQTPTKKVLSDGLRDNIMTDIAFKQRDAYGSRMAIGNREAEFLDLYQCIVRNIDKVFKITRLDI